MSLLFNCLLQIEFVFYSQPKLQSWSQVNVWIEFLLFMYPHPGSLGAPFSFHILMLNCQVWMWVCVSCTCNGVASYSVCIPARIPTPRVSKERVWIHWILVKEEVLCEHSDVHVVPATTFVIDAQVPWRL